MVYLHVILMDAPFFHALGLTFLVWLQSLSALTRLELRDVADFGELEEMAAGCSPRSTAQTRRTGKRRPPALAMVPPPLTAPPPVTAT